MTADRRRSPRHPRPHDHHRRRTLQQLEPPAREHDRARRAWSDRAPLRPPRRCQLIARAPPSFSDVSYLDAAKSWIPTPGADLVGEDEARDRVDEATDQLPTSIDYATSVIQPPETETGAAAEVATLGLGGAALRLARKGGDEAVRVSKKAIKKSGRLAWRNPGKTSAAGAVGIETIDPGSVSGPLGDALDRTGDATANIAGEAGEGAAGAVAETVGQTLRETTKGLTEDWLGTAVLVAGGIVAALALTPLAEWVASELGEGST